MTAAATGYRPPATLPEELKALKGWLVWRLVQLPGESKLRKVPYYVSGKPRKNHGTEEDRAQLATFDQAAGACAKGGYSGLGLAILPDFGVVALDFDRVAAGGDIDPRVAALVDGTYAEFSPSGTGVRAFFKGSLPSRKNNDPAPGEFEVEVFGTSGFVTVTGNVLPDCELFGNDTTLAPITPAVRALFAQRFGAAAMPGATGDDDADWLLSVSPKVGLSIDDARRLLEGVSADCGYDDWLGVGQALHHEFDGSDEGLALFRAWSNTGAKPAADKTITGKWASFGRYTGQPRSMAWVLKAAKEQRAVNPELEDFWAYLPQHNYLFVPTRELWPGGSVNGHVKNWPTNPVNGKPIRPSDWLDKHRSLQQMTWWPGASEIIENRAVFDGGVVDKDGVRVFNLYREAEPFEGNALQVAPWRDHLRAVYPEDADHIERWLAHRVQRPGEKLNHALVLGGVPGIGKDTLLEPVKRAVGAWNWQDIGPQQVLGNFNGWAKAVVVRLSEARDLGDVSRYALYEGTKTYIAAPPDVIRVNEKNLREHYVVNVLGLVITTNHRSDGLYLPADDRRHYVAWSDRTKEEFGDAYWRWLWAWLDDGGAANVAAYLRSLDLSGFNPKASPPKTPAFWVMVAAGEAPESNELRDAIGALEFCDAFTLSDLVDVAGTSGLAYELNDRKHRRSLPHKFERVGYVPVRNPDAKDGAWVIGGRRQSVYSRADLAYSDQVRAARALRGIGGIGEVGEVPPGRLKV
ncbi:PriCT-2 domain-containing protein [Rivibacter subsaxonicus]|uniref:Primase-polymerase (Primpol)-like protein n=1 Tax=Rivibacter subsaxonicus TaxID=457575 RepID=A0A4Q7VDC9_9BURK|nr:PriCT-2 domain-containing protein [Rivibacter subsaxonicus]RZT93720.1 primase-polymerase (primpol)-like protein [Rivibacter subsaxonicus]